jgi:ribonuclease T2
LRTRETPKANSYHRTRRRSVAPAAVVVLLGLTLACAEGAAAEERHESAGFDYYVLVLSWSPSYCATGEAEARDDPQCEGKRPNFTLHGLWPQYVEGWPQDCWTKRRPWVPEKIISEMRDIMPSKGLIIHEYRTHGTCAGLSPEQYFGVARDLYERVAIPFRLGTVSGELRLSPDDIEAEFLRANSWLKPDMISVTCKRGALRDVRFCFAPDLFPTRCGANEERRLCSVGEVTLSPARSR